MPETTPSSSAKNPVTKKPAAKKTSSKKPAVKKAPEASAAVLPKLPTLSAELREKAVGVKKRISARFMLVDPATAKTRLCGETFYVTRKIDGVMACAFYQNGDVLLAGSGGRNLSAAPCVQLLAKALKQAKVETATIVCELYRPSAAGRPRVGDVLAALTDPEQIASLRLAPFAIEELDGESFTARVYGEVHAKLAELFTDEAVLPVEMQTVQSYHEVEAIYHDWVEGEDAEGLVIHSDASIIWKLKPRHMLDAVVVGYTRCDGGVRDLLFAVREETGEYRLLGATGNGLTQDERRDFLIRLEALETDSSLVRSDSRGVAFRMVKPEMVLELSVGEFVAEDSQSRPKENILATFDAATGWSSLGRVPGVSLLHAVFERVRDDKAADAASVRVSQVTDIAPFAAPRVRTEALPESEVLCRKVYKKESGGKLMVQKFLVWKTNKEADPRYPAYVYHYTDFSSGRKDPLKRDIRVSSDKEQLLAFFTAEIAAKIKKGWVEV